MIKSQYTVLIDNFPEQEKHLFFSTITQAMVVIDQELKRTVEQLPRLPKSKESVEALATLARMGFLVHDERQDERTVSEWIRAMKADTSCVQPRVLTTYACNFACTYCVEQGVIAPLSMDDIVAKQSAAYIRGRVEELEPRSLFVTFYGGEPLINTRALKIVAGDLQEFCRARGLPFAFGITTNGALLTPEVVEELAGLGLKGVKITLDGMREHHDSKRPFKNGRGSFNTILLNILRAVDTIDVDVGCNFDEENIDSIAALLDHLKQLGLASKLHAVRFTPISKVLADREGLPPTTELDCVYSKPGTARHMVELRRLALERGFKMEPGIGVNMCSVTANGAIFTIDPLGKIYKCPALVGRREFQAGDIFGGGSFDHGPSELWKRCLGCPYLPLCGEGCLFGALVRFGDPYRLNCQKEFVGYMVEENLKINYLNRQNTSR